MYTNCKHLAIAKNRKSQLQIRIYIICCVLNVFSNWVVIG